MQTVQFGSSLKAGYLEDWCNKNAVFNRSIESLIFFYYFPFFLFQFRFTAKWKAEAGVIMTASPTDCCCQYSCV